MINIKYILAISLFCAGCYIGYTFEHSRFETYKAEASANYTKLLEEKIALDKNNRERVTELEKQRINELERMRVDYEKTIADMRTSFNPSGVYEGSSASCDCDTGKNGNSSGLICFTEAELRRKIENTLVIGKAADELAVKYNTLLSICGGN